MGRAGEYISNLSGEMAYRSFRPASLPSVLNMDEELIGELSALHDRSMAVIDDMGRVAKTAKVLFFYLEQNPIIDIGKTAEALGLSFSTVSGALKRLEEKNIIVQTNDASRNRVFAYQEYLNILRKDT